MKPITSLMALCALLAAAPAAAIVNVEAVRNAALEPGLHGEVGLAMSMIASASEELRIDADGRIDWLHGGSHDFMVAEGSHSEVDGLRRQRGMLHLRHVQALNNPLAQSPYQTRYNWELFAQAAHDDYAALRQRSLAGTGLRLNRPFSASTNHALGLGVMSEWRQVETPGQALNINVWRANMYLSLNARWGDQVVVGSTTYFQPRLEDWSDFSAIEEFFLDTALSERLSLRLLAGIVHDSSPAPGVHHTRAEYGFKVVYRFGG